MGNRIASVLPGIQMMRRMRAMLLELLADVRPEHRSAAEKELARLDASNCDPFAGSPDLDRAGGADTQGIGGEATPLVAASLPG